MARDIVTAFCEALLAEQPGAPSDLVRRIEVRLRNEWGGDRVYVPKDSPTEGKVGRLAAALAAGVPLKAAFDQCGVSRSAGYRLILRRRLR